MKLSAWVGEHSSVLLGSLTLYVSLIVILPGRFIYKHGFLPQWYRFNGLLSAGLLLLLVPEVLYSMRGGWTGMVCRSERLYSGFFSGTAMSLFLLTKFTDLAETILIILERRKPLIIHMIHHFCTVVFVWISYSKEMSLLRIIAIVNLSAHLLLFAYLTPSKLKFGVHPCYLSVVLGQILQFLVAIYACYTARKAMDNGMECDVDSTWLQLTQIGLIAFLFIFGDFYHQKYVNFRRNRNCEGVHSIRDASQREQKELRSQKQTKSHSFEDQPRKRKE